MALDNRTNLADASDTNRIPPMLSRPVKLDGPAKHS